MLACEPRVSARGAACHGRAAARLSWETAGLGPEPNVLVSASHGRARESSGRVGLLDGNVCEPVGPPRESSYLVREARVLACEPLVPLRGATGHGRAAARRLRETAGLEPEPNALVPASRGHARESSGPARVLDGNACEPVGPPCEPSRLMSGTLALVCEPPFPMRVRIAPAHGAIGLPHGASGPVRDSAGRVGDLSALVAESACGTCERGGRPACPVGSATRAADARTRPRGSRNWTAARWAGPRARAASRRCPSARAALPRPARAATCSASQGSFTPLGRR